MRAAPRRFPACLLAAVAVLAACTAGLAGAQSDPSETQVGAPVATGSGPLAVSVEAEILTESTGPDGRTMRRWQPATRLRAGEEVYYTLRVHNPGRRPVESVVVTKRLPFGVAYQPGSAVGPDCQVQLSTDGGTTFAPADTRSTDAQARRNRKAPVVEYTHVRWILARPLAPGATALLRFRAVFT